LAALFGGKTKGEKANEASFQGKFDPLIAQQTGASKSALDFALPLLKQGTDTLQGPISYWGKLAGGDRNAISQLFGPELDSISQRDAAQRQNFSQFAPRGTMMNNRLGALDQGTISDINRLFLSARPQANDQLANLAQLLYGTGISGLNASTGASGNALGALLNYRSGNLQSQQLRQAGNQNIFKLAQGLFGAGGIASGNPNSGNFGV
jgi:hypothetical protein